MKDTKGKFIPRIYGNHMQAVSGMNSAPVSRNSDRAVRLIHLKNVIEKLSKTFC